jgi:hypothetical protein
MFPKQIIIRRQLRFLFAMFVTTCLVSSGIPLTQAATVQSLPASLPSAILQQTANAPQVRIVRPAVNLRSGPGANYAIVAAPHKDSNLQ